MLEKNKIKFFNKYTSYLKIEMMKNNFFNRKIKIYEGKNYSPKIKPNDPLYDEIKNLLIFKNNIVKKTNLKFASEILKLLINLKKN